MTTLVLKKNLFTVILFFGLLISNAQTFSNWDKTRTVKVVLLAGQSNMQGAGNYNKLCKSTKRKIKKVSQRVFMSNNGESVKSLSYTLSQWQKEKRGFAESFGPEILLGVTLSELDPKQQYLFIKTAVGGTALYGAWNPEWTAEKAEAVEKNDFRRTTKLYSLFLSHIKSNLDKLESEGIQYDIVGMLWFQGENDAAKEIAAYNYKENLKKLIFSYRSALDIPTMPFVIGQINSTYGDFNEGPEMVRNAMVQVANEDQHALIIETSTDPQWIDYPKHTDNIHYNTEGQVRLGKDFAIALRSLNPTLSKNKE